MVYILLAEGFETVEALAPADILTRAGVKVALAGVEGREIASSQGITIKTNISAEDISVDNIEALVLPGGLPGTHNLEKSPVVQQLIDDCVNRGKLIAAICAAPSILAHKGLLKDREATAFPGFQEELTRGGARLSADYVHRDGQFLTARGMGVSVEFGLALAGILASPERAAEIKVSIQCRS